VDLNHIGQGEPLGVVKTEDADFVTGACMMTRRDVLDSIGWYAVECVLDWGDVDFCLRARKAGYRIRFAASARGIHIEAATRGMRSGPIEWFMERWANSPLVLLPDEGVVPAGPITVGGS
jgi:GT2 family glycosyltransferase